MNERNLKQSVIFQIKECMDAFDVLKEVNIIYKDLFIAPFNKRLPFRRELVAPLLGVVRDDFSIRLACLFDKRKDVHSLKKYFKGLEINRLEKHPVTKDCVKARHGNIAHLGKKFVKWPEVENIINSNIRELLEMIYCGVLLS